MEPVIIKGILMAVSSIGVVSPEIMESLQGQVAACNGISI